MRLAACPGRSASHLQDIFTPNIWTYSNCCQAYLHPWMNTWDLSNTFKWQLARQHIHTKPNSFFFYSMSGSFLFEFNISSHLLAFLLFHFLYNVLLSSVCLTGYLLSCQPSGKHFLCICHSHLVSICFFFLSWRDWQQEQALAFPHLGMETLTGTDCCKGCALNTEQNPKLSLRGVHK